MENSVELDSERVRQRAIMPCEVRTDGLLSARETPRIVSQASLRISRIQVDLISRYVFFSCVYLSARLVSGAGGEQRAAYRFFLV